MTTGLYIALLGAVLAFAIPSIGSAIGITKAGQAATGLLSEQTGKGNVITWVVFPSSQGLYGFIAAFLVLSKLNLIGGTPVLLTEAEGFAVLFSCIPVMVACFVTPMLQGYLAASAIAMYGKKRETFGTGMMMIALSELFAIFALVVTILLVMVGLDFTGVMPA